LHSLRKKKKKQWKMCEEGQKMEENTFVSVWRIDKACKRVQLPFLEGGEYDCEVDWGDGTVTEVTRQGEGDCHVFATAGHKRICVTGVCRGFSFAESGQGEIVSVMQWGPVELLEGGGYFQGCSSLHHVAKPQLCVTSLDQMFQGAKNFNGLVRTWDVSKVTSMREMFAGAKKFNQDLSEWDVSNVLDMTRMFHDAAEFRGHGLHLWQFHPSVQNSAMFANPLLLKAYMRL
jgi:surface protein